MVLNVKWLLGLDRCALTSQLVDLEGRVVVVVALIAIALPVRIRECASEEIIQAARL